MSGMGLDQLAVFGDHSDPVDTPDDGGTSALDTGTPTPSAAAPSTPSDAWDVPGHGSLSRDEIIKGYLRQQDYTRKTMAAAQREREFGSLQQQHSQQEQILQQVRDFLQDRERLSAYLQQLPGGQPELAPDSILTAAEAQALMQQRLGRTEQQFGERLQQTEQRIIQGIYETQYTQSIDTKLRSLGERYPELTRVPGMEMLLREAVKSQQPQTIEDVMSLFDQAATYYSTQLKGLAKQQVAVQPNNPLTRGILPPSGGAPMPEPEPTDFTGVKDPRLHNLVMQDLQRLAARTQ
jgi:hypothetical protein